MSRRFDRTDYESRGLRATYEEIGNRLGDEAELLRAEIHERFYPTFGIAHAMAKRFILQRLRGWDDIFRELADRLFRLSSDVEEKLIYSLAYDQRTDYSDVFERIKTRRGECDQLLRAINFRMRSFQAAEAIDTEAAYEFCLLARKASLFFRFVSLILFNQKDNPISLRDPAFFDIDLAALEETGRTLPGILRAEYAEFSPVEETRGVPVPTAPPPAARGAPGNAGPARGAGGGARPAPPPPRRAPPPPEAAAPPPPPPPPQPTAPIFTPKSAMATPAANVVVTPPPPPPTPPNRPPPPTITVTPTATAPAAAAMLKPMPASPMPPSAAGPDDERSRLDARLDRAQRATTRRRPS